MPEVLTENKTCVKCGAEIRRDTQFCYNCGDEQLPESGPAKPDTLESSLGSTSAAAVERDKDARDETVDSKLTSAASLRRKGRTMERKVAETVWEPAGDRPNWILMVSTLVFVGFAAAVVISALYYR